MTNKFKNTFSSPGMHVTFPLLLLTVLTLGVAFTVTVSQQQQTTRSQAAGDCTVSSEQMEIKIQEQELLDLVNQYRAENGVGPLTWDSKLKQAAAWLSNDMVTNNHLSHFDSLGRTPDIRLPDCGVNTRFGYGENIASGPPAAPEILNSWKNSPAHNEILLKPDYTRGGIAMEVNTSGTQTFWVMDFGSSQSSDPVPPGNSSPAPTTSNGQPTMTSAPTQSQNNPNQPTRRPGQPSPTSTRVAVDMQVGVKVKFIGVGLGGNLSPKNLSRRVQAFVYGTDDKPVTTGTGFLSYDGNEYFTGVIRLGRLNEGTYIIKLVGDTTLQKLVQPEFQTLLVEQINDLPPVTLFQGDMNDDNVLNITDFNIALTCFQNTRCDTAKSIDFNDDGTADVTDYNILLRSFGELQGK